MLSLYKTALKTNGKSVIFFRVCCGRYHTDQTQPSCHWDIFHTIESWHYKTVNNNEVTLANNNCMREAHNVMNKKTIKIEVSFVMSRPQVAQNQLPLDWQSFFILSTADFWHCDIHLVSSLIKRNLKRKSTMSISTPKLKYSQHFYDLTKRKVINKLGLRWVKLS